VAGVEKLVLSILSTSNSIKLYVQWRNWSVASVALATPKNIQVRNTSLRTIYRI